MKLWVIYESKTVRLKKYQKRSFNTHYILCISFFIHLRNFEAAPQIYAFLTSSHTHLIAKAGTNHIRNRHPPMLVLPLSLCNDSLSGHQTSLSLCLLFSRLTTVEFVIYGCFNAPLTIPKTMDSTTLFITSRAMGSPLCTITSLVLFHTLLLRTFSRNSAPSHVREPTP